MSEFDPGPPERLADLFLRVPDYEPFREYFWYDWGPIFYRGRLDGEARVMCVASDPGPTERVAMRTLVGDAGQRVQGFLAKIGLTRSYVCLNAYPYALFPSRSSQATRILRDPAHLAWRNELFDALKSENLQAVIAFGENAQLAVSLWQGKGELPVFEVPHPSSRDPRRLLDGWRAAVSELRGLITPDPDGNPSLANYGSPFRESDYARVPLRDLPFGVPVWLGDDAWGRRDTPKHNNSVRRPGAGDRLDPYSDDFHTLIWTAPRS